jgi:hypothetical protein
MVSLHPVHYAILSFSVLFSGPFKSKTQGLEFSGVVSTSFAANGFQDDEGMYFEYNKLVSNKHVINSLPRYPSTPHEKNATTMKKSSVENWEMIQFSGCCSIGMLFDAIT